MSSTETAVKSFAACKIAVRHRNQGWSGTGTICGYDNWKGESGAWALTNQHVATSQVGKEMKCQFHLPSGTDKTFNAINYFSAYSTSRMVDWAFVFMPGLTFEKYGIKPHKLSKSKPILGGDLIFNQTGSPRGVWPLTSVDFKYLRMVQADAVALLTPISIGGQSGSGLRNPRNRDVIELLLTWAWDRRYCACQETTDIWNAIVNRSFDHVRMRPDGLEEVNDGTDRDTKEGFFAPSGIEMAAGHTLIPVWDDGEEPSDPDDPAEPEPPMDLNPLLKLLKEDAAAQVAFSEKELELAKWRQRRLSNIELSTEQPPIEPPNQTDRITFDL